MECAHWKTYGKVSEWAKGLDDSVTWLCCSYVLKSCMLAEQRDAIELMLMKWHKHQDPPKDQLPAQVGAGCQWCLGGHVAEHAGVLGTFKAT